MAGPHGGAEAASAVGAGGPGPGPGAERGGAPSVADLLSAEIDAAEALIAVHARRVAALASLRAAVLGGAALSRLALDAARSIDAAAPDVQGGAPRGGGTGVGPAAPALPLPGATFESMLAGLAAVSIAGRGAVTAMELVTLVPRSFRSRRGGGQTVVNALHVLVVGTSDGLVSFHAASTGALLSQLSGALGAGAGVTGLAHDATYDAPLLVAGSDGTLAVVALTSWVDGRLNWGVSQPVAASNEVPLPAPEGEEGSDEETSAASSAAPRVESAGEGDAAGARLPGASHHRTRSSDPNAPTAVGALRACAAPCAPDVGGGAGHALRATVLTRVSTATYDQTGLSTPPAISACALYVMRRQRFLIVGDTEGTVGVFAGNGTLLHVARPPPPEGGGVVQPHGRGAEPGMPLRVSAFAKSGAVLAFARGAAIGFLNVYGNIVVGDVQCRGSAARVVGLTCVREGGGGE